MSTNSKWIEGIGPQSTVEEAARRSMEPRLTAVNHLMPMAAYLAEHDVEHVHRVRVATRRATAALKLYRDCLDRQEARWMKRRLRKIRRAAGDARDLDVLADRLAHDYGEPAAPVIELIANDRAAVQPAIVRVVDRCRKHDRFVHHTAELLHSVGRPKANDGTVPLLLRNWARNQWAQIAKVFTAAMPNEHSPPAELHQFRIRAKAVRYAIELVAPVFEPRLRETLYPTIEKLQERLGRVQDHVAAIERCQMWSKDARDVALQDTLHELTEAERRGLTNANRQFHEWWTVERAERLKRCCTRGHAT